MERPLDLREYRLLLGLTIAMAFCPAMAMRWADWVPGLWVLQALSILSVLTGFFLAISRFSSWTAFLASLVYGLFAIGLFSGMLLPSALPWHERIPQLVYRQAEWLIKAANVIIDPDAADTSRDGLIFIMQTGFILWLLGFTAAWYTFRRLRIWRALLPSALLLLITEVNYYGQEPLGMVLVVFMVIALLYIVGTHYAWREGDWMQSRVVFSKGTYLDFLQVGFLIVVVALPFAWMAPNVSAGGAFQEAVQPLDRGWERIQDGWTQLFASLKSYGGEYSDPYGNVLALGGPRRITPSAIMDVRSNQGRYWRAKVYDTYTGDGWASTAETRVVVSPDDPLEFPTYRQTIEITATFTSYLPDSGLIYFPHQPAGTDRQARFTVFDLERGSYDVVSSLSRYVIYEGKSYDSWGTMSVALDMALTRAGTNYPEWVEERYLQLPSEVSPKVVELASAVAAPFDTPYEKADALTDWLRTNIEYNEGVEAPPVDVDPLEYLLFETKQGYCNYFASALAVMLRTQGIPARVAAGYARGTWQEELGVYRVYSTDAHVWTEVFFPGFGWVEFEATSGQPAILRTTTQDGDYDPNTTETDENLPEEGPEILDEDQMLRDMLEGEDTGAGSLDDPLISNLGLIIGGVVLGLILLGGVVFLVIDRSRIQGLSAVAQVYDRMSSLARWLDVHLRPTQTPYERAKVLVAAAPDAAAPIDVVTDLYVEERFGQAREGLFDERAHQAWSELWPIILRKGAARYLHRFQRDEDEKPRLES